MKRKAGPEIIFITGTDTGVGKTLLTGLLLQHLRRTGRHALAVKPFSSGSRSDARLLHALQGGELDLDEINPFFFKEPLAPLVAARGQHSLVTLPEVLKRIAGLASGCECLLIEGIGGFLVPLGASYTVADVVAKLRCKVIVVSANRLGTINHTLLTVKAAQQSGLQTLTVVLMGQARPDSSADSNGPVLASLLNPVPVFTLDFLGTNATRPGALKAIEKKFQKSIALVLGSCNFSHRSL
jgi:dethiobiotin synthetase